MAQRDYVSRERSKTRRKNYSRKKNPPIVSKMMVALAVVVICFFAGGLYFITHNSPEIAEHPVPSPSQPNPSLPPKPEPRWGYITKLEEQYEGVSRPVDPSTTAQSAVKQPSDEQKQILQQFQNDRPQPPTQLARVSAPEQHQAASQTQTPQAQAPQTQEIVTPDASGTLRTLPPRQIREPSTSSSNGTQVQTDFIAERWVIRCGSYREPSEAESIRAQLAFSGIESHVSAEKGENRVVIGPYNSRSHTDKVFKKIRGHGNSRCIVVGLRG